MDLKITSYNNFFTLKGILNRDNIHIFQNEFRHVFDKTNAIIINIEGLEFIDRHGVNAFAKLHSDSISKNKKLAIIGLGCEDLYDHFKSEAA